MKNWGNLSIALLGAFYLAFLFVTPPSAAPENHDVSDFSSARAMEDVRIIAAEPHPTGTPENAKVRQYIQMRLADLGLDVQEHPVEITGFPVERLNRWNGREDTSQTIYNITGILPGKDRTLPALLLMAHHDTVWDSPGASDDTIGIAVILEVLRAINGDENRERDVIVLITDAEELGLAGAVNFFERNPLRNRVGVILNLEARGAGGTANLFQLNKGNGEAARFYGQHVREPSISSLSAFVYETLPNDTDLTPALDKDYLAYNMAIIGKAGMYHSPKITPDELEENSVQHMGVQTLDLTRGLLFAKQLPSISDNAIFFDVFGLFVITYASFWGWAFLGLGLVFFVLSVRGALNRIEMMAAMRQTLLFLLGGAVALYALNWLSGHGKTYEGIYKASGYYDRLAAIPRLELIALFVCLAAAALFFGRDENSQSRYIGFAIPIISIGILGQILAPTATYFISIPVFFAGLTALGVSRLSPRSGQLLAVSISIPIIGYMIGLAHLLLVGVGPDMLSIAILPFAIGSLMAVPLFPLVSSSLRRLLVITFILLAVVIALWVRFDPIAATVPTYQVW